MTYKTYSHPLPFTDIVDWCWPAGDKKLVQVFDHVMDIDVFMRHVRGENVCVQAGGACGVWPYRYAQLFDDVYTFEPQPENWHCLQQNIGDINNIHTFHAPLSNDRRAYSVKNDIVERENWGAGYIVPDDNGIEAVLIDDLELNSCDLIQLDIEGYELQALQGAENTIAQYRPVIVLEEKPLNHMRGDHTLPRQWLEKTFGYRLAEIVHRDVVLTC